MKKIGITIVACAFIISCDSTKNVTKLDVNSTKAKVVKSTFFIDSVTVKKHLYTLASDEMEGRKSGTRGIEKAAKYIENEFKIKLSNTNINSKNFGNIIF